MPNRTVKCGRVTPLLLDEIFCHLAVIRVVPPATWHTAEVTTSPGVIVLARLGDPFVKLGEQVCRQVGFGGVVGIRFLA